MRVPKNLLILFLFFAGGAAGFWLHSSITQDSSFPKRILAMRAGQNGLINPLLEYEISDQYYTKALKIFREDLEKFADAKIKAGEADKIAVYFRGLNNGPWFGIRYDENFFPASLLKVPLMISYLKWAESNPEILEKKVTYSQDYFKMLGDFNSTQYIKSHDPITVGQTYTIEKLIEKAIVDSDNNAKNLLVFNLDTPDRLFNTYTDLGLATPPELRGEGDTLSVHEYATFFRILYNASYLNRELSKKALEILSRSSFREGLVAKLPKEVQVAHKFGEHADENFRQLHDCGIIYYPKYPYILCVMSRGQEFKSLESVIADLSLKVYEEIDRQVKNGQSDSLFEPETSP